MLTCNRIRLSSSSLLRLPFFFTPFYFYLEKEENVSLSHGLGRFFSSLSLSEIRFNRLKMVLKEGGRVGGWEREEEENEERAPRALQFYKLRRRENERETSTVRSGE